MQLNLYFSAPTFATNYDASQLSEKDQLRINKHPKLAQSVSWQNSRALKQYLKQSNIKNYCLSHKNNYALIAHFSDQKIGVDLEYINATKDVTDLCEFICNPYEQPLIAQSINKIDDFYRLWTIKESIIKAEDLRFPSDLKKIGLKNKQNDWRVLSLKKEWDWISVMVNNHWRMSVVLPKQSSQEITIFIHVLGFESITINSISSSLKCQCFIK